MKALEELPSNAKVINQDYGSQFKGVFKDIATSMKIELSGGRPGKSTDNG
jgi:hypothetical protein